jgi:hypothetical protein
MFHATIFRDVGIPLRVSGQVVPYDLQVLREHIFARGTRATRLEVRLPASLRAAFVRVLRDLEQRGIELVLDPRAS